MKILTYIIFCYVSSVLAEISPFFDKGQRAKLFEMLDNRMPVIRITIPEQEYKTLINVLNPNQIDDSDDEEDTSENVSEETTTEVNTDNDISSNENEEFKTKNATMIFELDEIHKLFKNVTFSLGGQSSLYMSKPGYNIKINGDDDLYGRQHLRLRSDFSEPTYMRSKIMADIHNRLGLPSISVNYAILYLNGENMGLYMLMDIFKDSWVERVYGEKNTTTLYKCDEDSFLTLESSSTSCKNQNDEVTDHTEWLNMLSRLDQAEKPEDIEDIFDIDQFLKEIAIEYLTGAWDHIIKNTGHNYFMYKPVNGKWQYLLFDFDLDFGYNLDLIFMETFDEFFEIAKKDNDFTNYSFKDFIDTNHIIDILVLRNSDHFDQLLKDIVKNVFNPAVLFPHIDEVKEFIRPYVKLDKTQDKNGNYPGRIKKEGTDYLFNMKQWENSVEYTMTKLSYYDKVYGLKQWILGKYKYVCKTYNIECDKEFLELNVSDNSNKASIQSYNEDFNENLNEDIIDNFIEDIDENIGGFNDIINDNSSDSFNENSDENFDESEQ